MDNWRLDEALNTYEDPTEIGLELDFIKCDEQNDGSNNDESEVDENETKSEKSTDSEVAVSVNDKVEPETSGEDKVEPETSGEEKVEPETSGEDKVEPETSGEEKVEPETSGEEKVEPESGQLSPEELKIFSSKSKVGQSTFFDLRNDLPKFRSGDTISIGYRVVEGSRSRVQIFEGVVIKISAGHDLDKTFTVRKISSGIGVERIFPFHSPNIEDIKVLKKGKVRRAKLYYLRDRKGKAARIKERV